MDELTFPVYYKCISKFHFEELNAEAAELINSDSYQQPLIDANNQYWFIVNSEVSSLVNLEVCVNFDSIVFPSNSI